MTLKTKQIMDIIVTDFIKDSLSLSLSLSLCLSNSNPFYFLGRGSEVHSQSWPLREGPAQFEKRDWHHEGA